jgi:hypothetical protein
LRGLKRFDDMVEIVGRRPMLIGNVELLVFEKRVLNVLVLGGKRRREQT